MGKCKRPKKCADVVAIPTPFGALRAAERRGTSLTAQPSSGDQFCMFPGCSTIVTPITCDNTNKLSINVLAKSNDSSGSGGENSVILRMVSCDTHGHLMRARGLKKDMELQQFSHMRNVYTTLHLLVQDSCKSILQEIGEY